jgi:hypothetical protein
MSVVAAKRWAETRGIEHDATLHKHSLSPSEGVKIFERILDATFPRIAVLTRDLATVLQELGTHMGPALRASLHKPIHARPRLGNNYVLPRNRSEQLLAGIWQKLLGLEEVGIHDNFFDLGGHSLLATQVMSRVREAFQVDLALRVLFEAPTVAELALRVEQRIANAGELAELAHNLTEVESLSDYEIERQLHASNRS